MQIGDSDLLRSYLQKAERKSSAVQSVAERQGRPTHDARAVVGLASLDARATA